MSTNNQQLKTFYTKVPGLEVIREVYWQQHDSYKLDLTLQGEYILEVFSFPAPLARSARPQAAG